MAKEHCLKPEQIVTLSRQIDVLTTNGKTLAQACKQLALILSCSAMANIYSSNSAVCSSNKSDIASFTGMGLRLAGGYLSLSNH